ncbi:MAG: AAA family ATPase [Anaerolineae bacterium]|nr:AAA family ATPase [Anaerolineae bacterium]
MSNKALIQALEAAIEASPDVVLLRKHLGDLLMADNEFAEASGAYRQALDLAPDDDDIKLALARAYDRQGKRDVALVVLEQMMRGPDAPSAQALILAARLYLASKEVEQAAQAYRQAVAQDPALADPDLEPQLVLVESETPPLAEQFAGPDDGEKERQDRTIFVSTESVPTADDLLELPGISFQDVGGMEALKEEIRIKIIYPLTHPDIYRAYGKSIGGGILMYGPPGCGKTYLARATAGQVRARFISVGLHDVLDMYIGQSEQKLHGIFELARDNTPCVLFFDEVDALGASRADMRFSAGRKVINQFLAELDGVEANNEGVLVLAATNAPWHVDPAMRRPGRFDRVLFVPPPDVQARAAILRVMLADKPIKNIDYGKLARTSVDFSGADLKGAVDLAVEQKLRQAIETGIPEPLTTRDLERAINGSRSTIKEWFATARNYAIYANQGGMYDDILDHLHISRSSGLFSGRSQEER